MTDWISRRDLLKRAGAAGALAAVPLPFQGQGNPGATGPAPAAAAREPLENLTQVESDVLEAVVARLVPSDANGPGAAEARAAHYIDRALGGALASSRETYRQGLAAIDALAVSSNGSRFAQLTGADQDELLAALEGTPCPRFPRRRGGVLQPGAEHTLQGTFGDPYYGGNRNFVGWDLLGYPGVRLAVTPTSSASASGRARPTCRRTTTRCSRAAARASRGESDQHCTSRGDHGD